MSALTNLNCFMKFIFVILISLGAIPGCSHFAEYKNYTEVPFKEKKINNSESKQIIALLEAGKDVEVVVPVPAADSWVATGMVIAALKTGVNSTPVDKLTDILKASKVKTVTVVGESPSINRATIELAFRNMSGLKSSTLIYYAGTQDDLDAISRESKEAGLSFEGVIYP